MANKLGPTGSGKPARVVMIPDYRSTNPYQGLIAEQLEAQGVRVAFAQRARPRVFPIRAAVRERDVDVLHLHWITPFLRGSSVPAYLAFAARLLADIALVRATGVAVVWTIHNKVSHETRYPALEMWVRRCIAREVDAMIVHSAEIRREIAVDFRKPVHAFDIVPHASFGNLYGEAPNVREARESLALPANGRVFLNFGIMRPYKGLERLLEAWASSGLGRARNTLLLAGEFNDQAYRDVILTAARSLDGVRIDDGRIPDDRVRFYFGASDAVVLPFERILTSSSLHLAITFEKPVVAPRMASVVETLGQANHFLYDPENSDGLDAALQRCTGADLEAARSEIRNSRAALMDWHEVAQATLAVYQRARQRRASGRRE